MKVSAIGISWYTREDYPRILQVMDDERTLPRTYDDWVQKAETGERAQKAQGHVVVRAVIKPDEFVAWCRRLGLNVDSKARMRFANEAALREIKGEH